MTVRKKSAIAVFIISLAMAAVRTVLVTYSMEKNLYENNTYYLPDTFFVTAFTVLTFVFFAVFIYSAIPDGRKKIVVLDNKSLSVSAATLVLAFALIGAAAIQIIKTFFDGGTRTALGLCVLLFAALSAFKFLVSGLRSANKEPNREGLALTTLLPILLIIFRILGDFARSSAAPLASSGGYRMVGLCAALLYFLFEGRSLLSRGNGVLYTLFGYLTIYFLLVFAVPNLVLHCFGTFSFDQYSAYSVVDIGIVIYTTARMATARFIDLPRNP